MNEFDYRIKFWNPQKNYQKYGEEILQEIKKVAELGQYVLGPTLERFEKAFADYIGTKYAIGVNSGTDALYISLRALGIKKGDEVITVSNTFIATIETIVRCGATPILVDINNIYLIDVEKIEEAITEKTKAIIPVHLSGDVADMDRIQEIAKKYNLFVIEDAAQAFGAKWDNKIVGSMGEVGCFSLYPAKIMGLWGDGGVITTNNEKIHNECLLLRDHYKFTQSGHYTGKMPEIVQWVGNSRLDDVQAGVGLVKIRYMNEMLQKRKEFAELYRNGLKDLPVELPNYREGRVWQDYVLRVPTHQKDLAKFLDEAGIKVRGIGITPNHLIKGLNLEHFKLPKTEQYVSEFVRLPMSSELEVSEVEYIVIKIKEFYANII